MVVSSDTEREAKMRTLIEDALKRAGAKAGAPVEITRWGHGESEPELYVLVGGQRRVLEVSEEFLEDEPDGDALRKVAAAAREIVEGDARRVQLFHRGVFAAYGGVRV